MTRLRRVISDNSNYDKKRDRERVMGAETYVNRERERERWWYERRWIDGWFGMKMI